MVCLESDCGRLAVAWGSEPWLVVGDSGREGRLKTSFLGFRADLPGIHSLPSCFPNLSWSVRGVVLLKCILVVVILFIDSSCRILILR